MRSDRGFEASIDLAVDGYPWVCPSPAIIVTRLLNEGTGFELIGKLCAAVRWQRINPIDLYLCEVRRGIFGKGGPAP